MRSSRRQQSRQNYWSGWRAEWICRIFLMLKGYRILAHRYKTPVGEIDLIAQRGKTVVFIEVKRRKNITLAKQAIHQKNQKRVENTAKLFLSRYVHLSENLLRFDVMLVTPPFFIPKHIKNAWQT